MMNLMSSEIRIVIDDLTSAQVQALIGMHLEAMHQASPADSVHAYGLEQLRAPGVTVWSAWDGVDLLGIGALHHEMGSDQGEIKSMRTADQHLRRGVARALLRRILVHAKSTGLTRVSLETGTGAAFEASHRLYLGEGFEPCGPFGSYVDDPHSRFFTLDLRASGR